MAKAPVEALIYIAELSPSLQSQYQQYEHLQFSDAPVNIEQVLDEADFLVTHGGHQLMLQAAAVGVPQIHIPLTLEQQLLAYRCSLNGCSHYGFANEFSANLAVTLENYVEIKRRALQFSHKFSGYDSDPLGRCLALIHYHLGCVHN